MATVKADEKGYFMHHRKIEDWPWRNRPDYYSVWMRCLERATHKERNIIFNGKHLTLEAGQFVTGSYQMEKETGVNYKKVQRILNVLENALQIVQLKTTKGRLISITNWSQYQNVSHQLSSQCPTDVPPVSTTQEVKNLRTKNPVRVSKNGNYPEHFEEVWIQYGRKGGKKFAHERYKLHVNQEDIEQFKVAIPNYLLMCKNDDRKIRDFAYFIYKNGEAYWMNFTEETAPTKHKYRDV